MQTFGTHLTTDTIVIGAGPAGLAVSACLTRADAPFILLEKSEHIAATWRNAYDRLRLHTDKRFSALPFMPFPREYPTYVPRKDLIAYLERYAEHFQLQPRLNHEVTALRPVDEHWQIDTAQGRLSARRVVVATGYNAEPQQPAFPEQDRYRGALLHSVRYRNGESFRGQRVLVVGIGNTGAEIALDLHEHGAQADLSVRGPAHIVPRDLLGIPVQRIAILSSKTTPPAIADILFKPLIAMTIGDLSRYGIAKPKQGVNELVNTRGRIPVLDVGTTKLIKDGTIGVYPNIDRFLEQGVVFVDGRSRSYDAVISATGYRARLDRFLENAGEYLDRNGYPRWHGQEASRPGLYFIGFRNPITGMLREIAIEARRIAKDIAGF
jgi:cation diffusion facilitator CzcD-associated flavoprotein CzcO